ncbi:MAG TPA: DMT family protein [Polyangiaceae bacterium]|nr:DMT family protein [Polyangiaceae bacterium]
MPSRTLLVPLMIFASGAFMATAWLAHLRFRADLGFWSALALSWAIVLPEYSLNVFATRWGYGAFSGAQMAAMHLCSGVVCVALVSRFVLGEVIALRQLAGLALLAAGMVLVLRQP